MLTEAGYNLDSTTCFPNARCIPTGATRVFDCDALG